MLVVNLRFFPNFVHFLQQKILLCKMYRDYLGGKGVILGNIGYQLGNRAVMLYKSVLLADIAQSNLFCRKIG